jgi:predicted HTH transcriptional regulator
MNPTRLFALVEEMRAIVGEANWFELKGNNKDPDRIALTISALANAARLGDREIAFIVWGIADVGHSVIGTNFDPASEKVGGQVLQMWLGQVLRPCPNLQFHTFEHPDGRVILLEVPAATTSPVTFNGHAYIRLGSATPKLTSQTEVEAALWTKLRPFSWEVGVAKSYVSGDEILHLLDYASYFDLTGQPLPDNRTGIFAKLAADRLVREDVGGRWDILNLGAILFAKRLDDFPSISRKGVRIIEYSGPDRIETRRRFNISRGYASSFTSLMDQLDSLVPRNEEIGRALRVEHALYPPIAVREIVANALIHQDLTVTGAGPMIEIFPDRMETTNPGKPLVDPTRFMDMLPRSRNESLAALMRRMKICEEQGSGIDKALTAVELYQLPAPDFRTDGDSVRAVLFAPRTFGEMTPTERIRATYQHAGLRYLAGGKMTNASLRERFGLDRTNAGAVSRVMRDASGLGLIRLADHNAPKSGYVPFWA